MFEKYNELISIEKVLKDTYNYGFNGNLKDLLKQKFIEVEGNGVDALFWITYNGEKYLFKSLNDSKYNVWGEILSSYMAEYLNILHAEYRIASFDGKLGVISKSIIKGKEKLILGSELFQEFYNLYPYKNDNESLINNNKFRKLYEIPDTFLNLNIHDRKRLFFNYLNNLDIISSVINMAPNMSSEEKMNIVNGVKLTMIFDIITLQYDRHPNNWGVIKNKGYEFGSLFDNSTSFGLGYLNMQARVVNFAHSIFDARQSATFCGIDEEKAIRDIIYDKCPNLVCDTDDSIDPIRKIKKTIPEVLEHFLQLSSMEETDEIISMILSVDSNLIENLIIRAEEENHIKMDEQLKIYILTLFDNHLNVIHNIANKYRRIQNDISK